MILFDDSSSLFGARLCEHFQNNGPHPFHKFQKFGFRNVEICKNNIVKDESIFFLYLLKCLGNKEAVGSTRFGDNFEVPRMIQKVLEYLWKP